MYGSRTLSALSTLGVHPPPPSNSLYLGTCSNRMQARRSRPCGWDPSAQSAESKSEQARQCMDLEYYLHCLHCLHCLHWLHLEPTHLALVHAIRRKFEHDGPAVSIPTVWVQYEYSMSTVWVQWRAHCQHTYSIVSTVWVQYEYSDGPTVSIPTV
jgi:hypothetical protein